jgi:hypothetical protein
MMLDDLTRVTLTRSELLKHKNVVKYTSTRLSDEIEANMYDTNYYEFRERMAVIGNLQCVLHSLTLEYCLQLELRREIPRLIKLHEELYNASKSI